MSKASKPLETMNEKQLWEMARVGEEGSYSFWVYTESLKNPSFHLKHKTDFEIVLQINDLKILEIKHNQSKFRFVKGEQPPSVILDLINNFLSKQNKYDAKTTNKGFLDALWLSLNE